MCTCIQLISHLLSKKCIFQTLPFDGRHGANCTISAHNCAIMCTLHGTRVGRSGTLACKNDSCIFQRVIDSTCAVFKRQDLYIQLKTFCVIQLKRSKHVGMPVSRAVKVTIFTIQIVAPNIPKIQDSPSRNITIYINMYVYKYFRINI